MLSKIQIHLFKQNNLTLFVLISASSSPWSGLSPNTYQWLTSMKFEDKLMYLTCLLPTYARVTGSPASSAVASGGADLMTAGNILKNITELASPDGDSLQRVATYVNEGLAYRMFKNLNGVPEALRLTNSLSDSERFLVRKLFRELCPFLMFSYIITNHAISESMENEDVIHVIDLNACDSHQWIMLLHALKEQREVGNDDDNDENYRPLPFLKITGIHEKREVLDEMEFRLSREAEKLKFPFHFYAIVSKLEDVVFDKMPVKQGEPLAISSVLQLHSLLATQDQSVTTRISTPQGTPMDQKLFAEFIGKLGIKTTPNVPLSQCASPKMESFLNDLWKLQPRIMVITEQESNANGPTFMDRLEKTMNYYCTLFDCLESNVQKTRAADRIIVERMLLGEEIKNIVACEGIERKERHESAETWVRWLELGGFQRVRLGYERMLQVTRPLQSYGRGYKLIEQNQCLFACWNDRPLYSISAWKF